MSYTELYISSDPNISFNVKGKKASLRIVGVPFDYTSCFRPGSRFAPNSIRTAFQNIEIFSHRLGVDMENSTIEDLGNIRQTANIEQMIESVAKVTGELVNDKIPIAILGGEHSITYGSFGIFLDSKSAKNSTGLVIFDAHLDLRKEFSGLELSHATFLRQLIERRGLNALDVFHIGTRAASSEEWKLAKQLGINILAAHQAHDVARGSEQLREFAEKHEQIYVSIDLDGMDPAFVPAVGTPEPFGLTPEEVLNYIYALRGAKIPVFDIVELAVPYDNGTTAAVAAKLLNETACLASLREDRKAL